VEKLYYSFDSVDRTSAELDLNWAKKQFPVKVEFAVDEIVMANAKQVLDGQTGFVFQNLNAAANYSLAHNIDTAQGMQWVVRSANAFPNFTAQTIRAGFIKNAGDSVMATKIMKDALPLANDAQLNAYGYQLLAANKFSEAIEVFKMNTQRHPENPNTWDSLGEGYVLAGDKKNAIANFKKALSMNPPAPVKANSEKYLKQLGAM
jgi:predicted Zn-dependent protease